MTNDQTILFTLLGFVFVFLIWGRWRYDIVAFCALLLALIAGVVPSEQAFAGFGHPATVIIALVLVVSRGLSNSGAIELVARYVVDASRSVSAHIGILAGVSAALSAVMNNVAALALLMPVDLQAASNAKRSPALTLMPLSFAAILGGDLGTWRHEQRYGFLEPRRPGRSWDDPGVAPGGHDRAVGFG